MTWTRESHWGGGGVKGWERGGMSSGQLYIELFYPSTPACLFHRWGGTVYWRHCGGLCVFMSRKVKDCFKWRKWRGGDDPVQVLYRTQQTVKSFRKRISLKLCWERRTVFVNVDPLNIFACWCTYPCISPFVWRGWLIQKRFFWMLSTGQILMFWIWNIAHKKKKSLSWEEGTPKVFVCHCNSFRSGFWLDRKSVV